MAERVKMCSSLNIIVIQQNDKDEPIFSISILILLNFLITRFQSTVPGLMMSYN